MLKKITKTGILILAILLSFSSCASKTKPEESTFIQTESFVTESAIPETETPETEPAIEVSLDEIGVDSECVLLLDTVSGKSIIEKNTTERRPVASLTKLMTVLVAQENAENPAAEYTFTADVIDALTEKNAARAGFAVGESVRLCDLMYAAMLPSGADGAYALAMLTAGSIDGFVDMMNEKAAALGMNDTYFADPVGLDDSGYSTANDMAHLMQAVLANSNLREIISSETWLTAPTAAHPEGILLKSTVFGGFAKYGFAGCPVKGGKTGFTDGAGRCLATFAFSGNREYILITLGASDTDDEVQMSFVDQGNIYSACFIE